ncbi:10186_t:CDS:2, partial [Dentiscutata heterogama]
PKNEHVAAKDTKDDHREIATKTTTREIATTTREIGGTEDDHP